MIFQTFNVSSPRLVKTGLALLAASLSAGSLRAAPPENLGPGLAELVEEYGAANARAGTATLAHSGFATVMANHPLARANDADEVLVDVYLDGRKSVDDIVKTIKAMGGSVSGRVDWYRQGLLSAYLPPIKIAPLAKTVGVNTVNLSMPPRHHVGKTTSQGTKVLKSTTVNGRTYGGSGITVGVLSDSFDTNKNKTAQPTTNATQDAANDDLPGTGSASNTTPVYNLQDYGNTRASAGTDEGRAMCQIVHDVAPQANIAFATGDVSEAGFAQNIIALATPKTQNVTIPTVKVSTPSSGTATSGTASVAGGGCQVICDDLGYFDEPFFSDGVVAQAVDTVTKTYGVTYFSSAGNDGNAGYAATYNPQSNVGAANQASNQALLASQGGITSTIYNTIPAAERNVIESFHSFGTDSSGNPILVQKVKVPLTSGSSYGGTLIFQWDDPFNATKTVNSTTVNQVTTDYDIIAFSVSTSNVVAYQSGRSCLKVNASTNQPYEQAGSSYTAGTQYEICIVRTNRPVNGPGVQPNLATHIRYVLNSDAAQPIIDFATPGTPNSYGHPCAASCIGTAAYIYDQFLNTTAATYKPEIETFSSNGPSLIYFDNTGKRLTNPIARKQPTLSTVDGVNTSFFGGDSDGDGFPNFFGTSAASPHGAGCAALILNAAAQNSIALTPADVRQLLVSTTQGQQDLNPSQSVAASGPVKFNAFDRSTYTDPNKFTITYTGPAGSQLTSLVFDLTPISDLFFTAAYPVTFGASTAPAGTAPTISSSSLSNLNTGSTTTGGTETLNFANFNPGDTLSFGVATGNSAGSIATADDIAGGTFTATVTNADTTTTQYTGTLANLFGRKWNFKSGYGLVDVNAAVTRLLGHP